MLLLLVAAVQVMRLVCGISGQDEEKEEEELKLLTMYTSRMNHWMIFLLMVVVIMARASMYMGGRLVAISRW